MTVPDQVDRDIYAAPASPPPRVARPPWFRGLLLATLPSLVYFMLETWLVQFLPGLLVMVLWFGVVVLTFYGVGVFVWSSKSKPTWGRAVVAVLVTGAWMRVVSFLAGVATAIFSELAR